MGVLGWWASSYERGAPVMQSVGCAVVASDEGVPDEQEERIATCVPRVLPPPFEKGNLLSFPPRI